MQALIYGIPEDEDEEKTGIVNLIFDHNSWLCRDVFIERAISIDCAWIFDPKLIRQRMNRLIESGALTTMTIE